MRLTVEGLDTAEVALGKFAAEVDDLRPFWPHLAKRLADTTQRRWPLRRRTGRLRKSLTWRGSRLGPGGVFESDPDRLAFGTSLFYARFAQFGAKRQRATPLVHVDDQAHVEQLATWLRDRAARSGLEVDT